MFFFLFFFRLGTNESRKKKHLSLSSIICTLITTTTTKHETSVKQTSNTSKHQQTSANIKHSIPNQFQIYHYNYKTPSFILVYWHMQGNKNTLTNHGTVKNRAWMRLEKQKKSEKVKSKLQIQKLDE